MACAGRGRLHHRAPDPLLDDARDGQLAGAARRWEPKRLRLRLFSVAGRLVRGGRRLRLAGRWPWAGDIAAAVTRLQALPAG